MHEFSLAQGLFKQLLQLAREHHANQIITVRVAIGSLSGIVADSFAFGFETLAQGNELTSAAVLDITITEPEYYCLACKTNYNPTSNNNKNCTQCGSGNYTVSGGDDLILTQVEME